MFPEDDETTILDTPVIEEDPNFYKVPKYDFEQNKTVIENGRIVYISGAEAVKQWIIKFYNIFKNKVPVYVGTNFGTNFNEIFGQKYLNNGYEESEFERCSKEGLLLCPAIESITYFNMTAVSGVLEGTVEAMLKDGSNVKVEIENGAII